jgi:methionine-rich copper-binding protein CopC
MTTTLARTAALTLLLVSTLVAATPDARHFGLEKSSPEADASVESAPAEIRLWFTEEPQDGTVSIRVLEAEEAGVHVMDAAQDTEDPTVFFVQMHGTLSAGTYTVSWRGMGADGHVVRDTFQFSVAAR